MTARELVLRDRAAAVKALKAVHGYSLDGAEAFAAYLFPLPTRTVPTVRQGVADGGRWWYRVLVSCGNHSVYRYDCERAARNHDPVVRGWWPPEDQPTVAALLQLPLTEQVEDTGEDGAK